MGDDRRPVATGGCQCGAVRYALYAEPTAPSFCWCRMCQKATGSWLAAHTGVPHADFAWTRGRPGTFRSSEAAERDFCRDCGTALTYRRLAVDRISVTQGSLDEPYRYPPERQFGIEHRAPFAETMMRLPGVATADFVGPDAALYASPQHPDHD